MKSQPGKCRIKNVKSTVWPVSYFPHNECLDTMIYRVL